MSSIVLRIEGNTGRVRLVAQNTDTISSVRQQVAEKFQVPLGEVALTCDGRIIQGDNRTLQDAGLRSGAVLKLYTSSTQSFMVGDSPVQNSMPQREPVGSAVTKSASNVSLAASRDGTIKKKKKGEHNFKPFEAYMNEVDYDTASLPLHQSFKPVSKNRSGATPLPPTITLKHQAYRHVDHLEVMNVGEITSFVSHWRYDLDMLTQRAGYLIGYYRNDDHYENCGVRAVVEAIYEAEQIGTTDDVFLADDDPVLPMVERVAKALGLEIIGWVFTHLPREKLISASEVLRMGRLQLKYLHENQHYTRYPISTFVTMTISAKESLNGEPAPDAFMVSDLGLSLIRDGLIADETTGQDSTLQIRNPSPEELMPTVLERGQSVDKFDADWVLIRVNESAPKTPRSLLKRSTFPRIGRTSPTFVDVAMFLNDCPGGLESWEVYADFHFLLYVAQHFGVESAESICHAIRDKTAIDPSFEEILRTLA